MENSCNYCCEALLNIGSQTNYGSIVIYKRGNKQNGWFATLSPKTGGNPEKDFTVQLMPIPHIQHISEISDDSELAKNYGLAFSKIASAMNKIMKEEGRDEENEERVVRIGTYGKSKHPTEHFHIKLFPWTGAIGQPYTVDSSFGSKEIFKDEQSKEYTKMEPVKKKMIEEKRLNSLSNKLITLLKD